MGRRLQVFFAWSQVIIKLLVMCGIFAFPFADSRYRRHFVEHWPWMLGIPLAAVFVLYILCRVRGRCHQPQPRDDQ